jgi:20S proteasome subunit alpha 6
MQCKSVCWCIVHRHRQSCVDAPFRSTNELSSFQEKVFKIDDHMGIAIAGLTSDARTLATHMRSECLNYKYLYGSPMVTGRLVAALADKHQKKTMASWRRPYGVGMLVIGADVSACVVDRCLSD